MKPKYGALSGENLFLAGSLDDLSRDALITAMKKHTFLVIRGLCPVDEVEASVALLKSKFDRKNDRPTTGEKATEIRKNFQKLATGGASLRYNNFPRFFRTLYNPIWEADDFNLHKIFKTAIQVRNFLYGMPLDFALDKIEDNGLWSATRVHQYPKGGGFFEAHRDTTLLDVAQEKETNFYQIVIALSKKGTDYESGGAFVDLENTRYLLEENCELGDIIVYDGSTQHGVEDIDPDQPIDLETFNGRIAGFVSLYKVMD